MSAPGYERLSSLDTTFLDIERPGVPLHVGSLSIVERDPLVDDAGRIRIEDLRRLVESRLHLLPKYRQRLMPTPLSLGRPVWVDADRFDIAEHVKVIGLPAPGTDEQLVELAEELQRLPLDRTKPLWEKWFVDGLQGGRIGIVDKIHHAMVDGVSGAGTLTVLLHPDPEAGTGEPEPWEPRPAPSGTQLLAESARDLATVPLGWARAVASTARSPELLRERVGALRAVVRPENLAPRSSLNRPVGVRRRFLTVRESLVDLKELSHRLGVTVNDLVLAAVAGGLRSLLAGRGEPVDAIDLHALVPVSTRTEGDQHLGNVVSSLVAVLPVHEPDPAARLEIVRDAMVALKQSGEQEGTELVFEWADTFLPPVLALTSRFLVEHNPLVNVVVTNIPGPQIPLYVLGARLLEIYPVVPLAANLSLGIAILSYDGQLTFGIHVDPDACPDADAFAKGLADAFEELLVLG